MVEKNMKKTEKTRKLRLTHENFEKVQEMQYKNAQKRLRKALFPPEVDFSSIFGCPLGPRGPPGMSREPARSLPMFLRSFALSKNRARPGPGRPRRGPRAPSGTPQEPFWEDSWSIFEVDFQTSSYGDVVFFTDSFVKLIHVFVTHR